MNSDQTKPIDSRSVSKRIDSIFRQQTDVFRRETTKSQYLGKSIDVLMKHVPSIPVEAVDKYFPKDLKYQASRELIAETRKTLHEIRTQLNAFFPEKRFFILETIDFFRRPSHIGRVLPALLSSSDEGQRLEVMDFVRSTFSTLNKNIEIIISTPDIFSKESLHIERGGLYSLSADIAKEVSAFFEPGFLESFTEQTSDIARLKKVFRSSAVGIEGSSKRSMTIPERLVKDREVFRQSTLDFISVVQTHELLLLYARKRHAYYKRFVQGLLAGNHSKGFKSGESGMLLAIALMKNRQLKPDESLIKLLAGTSTHHSTEAVAQLGAFLNRLSPSTVYAIIGQYRQLVSAVLSVPEERVTKESNAPPAIRSAFSKLFRKPGE